jgi:hypothetical protein
MNPMKNPRDTNLKDVLQGEGILITLVTPLGFRSEWGALLGYLKIAEGRALEIERSELFFLDAAGNVIETRREAFGFGGKKEFAGPYSHRFSDDTRRPAEATTVRWRVNDMEVEAGLIESEGISLRVIYLPLLVSVEGDPHIVVTIVNRTGGRMDIAEGVRNAVCLADGTRFASNTGGHWDGGTNVQPDKSVTKQFSLDDFPGIPKTGRYQMSFEILGLTSERESVEWKGLEKDLSIQ